ncbi:MAG TPA: alpha/beta hydrolase, partial [Gemmataceae bacterium]|nr:alpha/beta hydrolase [Gemmataceae bacterium]
GVIFVISGGFVSSHDRLSDLPAHPLFNIRELLKRGYTVFAVVHGSQPKFTIPEILEDMHRATRFIRYHAKDYKIDPERIGITGLSAGGHLSLMQGTAGTVKNLNTLDSIDRISSRVQAVACFFPPTDFLNYGKEGEVALGTGVLRAFKAPFDFHEMDTITGAFVPVVLEQRRREIGKKISPAYHVTKESPPTLIIHGDKDLLVPIQQAEIMIAKFKEAGVPCELVVRKGEQHGWKNLLQDMKLVADWFDKYLLKKETTGATSAAK